MTDYRTEFPDYPVEAMPALPEGWTDASWHNDACPCFEFEFQNGHLASLYIDWPTAADREYPNLPRFGLNITLHGDVTPKSDRRRETFANDSLEAALAYFQSYTDGPEGEDPHERALCAEYEAWLKERPYFTDAGSADDLLADCIMTGGTDEKDLEWLSDFIDRWDAMRNAQDKRRQIEGPLAAELDGWLAEHPAITVKKRARPDLTANDALNVAVGAERQWLRDFIDECDETYKLLEKARG